MVGTIEWKRELRERGVGVNLPDFALLYVSVRLCFWFACFWAIIGVIWRPPLSSVGLIAVFLLLLIAVEWVSRRLAAEKPLPFPFQGTETVQQQMIRTTTAGGLDRLNGTFWAEFPADALTTTVHIPFCPAFKSVPKVQVLPMEETDANLRVVSPKAFGVRVDVRRENLDVHRLCFAVVAEG